MSSQALIDKILVQADAEAEQITDEILRRAGENEKLTLERAAAECKTTESDSERECAQILRIAELNSGLQSRKALLHARRELLDEAFGRAYRKVLSLKGAERVSFLCGLIKKHAPAKTFTACVSPEDAAALAEAVPGLDVRASEDIKCGVYMISDDADVDCTVDAIFEELREKYEAQADAIMYSGGV